MDVTCLDFRLTEAERLQFEQDGYFIVENALPEKKITVLSAAVNRVDAEYRRERGLDAHARINHFDFAGSDEAFIELADWPRTFAKVWEILGWNIQIYHTHVAVTPPEPEDSPRDLQLGWHQDSGRLNFEMEYSPRPRISLKVAYFLTDCSATGRGNFHIIPGSHIRDSMEFPGDKRSAAHENGIPVLAPRGSAVFFDRRLWHSASANFWTEPRRVLFYGYSYRWLRPRDDISVDRFRDNFDAIQHQLFGASTTGGRGYTSPQPEDVPLKAWIEEHAGAEAVAP